MTEKCVLKSHRIKRISGRVHVARPMSVRSHTSSSLDTSYDSELNKVVQLLCPLLQRADPQLLELDLNVQQGSTALDFRSELIPYVWRGQIQRPGRQQVKYDVGSPYMECVDRQVSCWKTAPGFCFRRGNTSRQRMRLTQSCAVRVHWISTCSQTHNMTPRGTLVCLSVTCLSPHHHRAHHPG